MLSDSEKGLILCELRGFGRKGAKGKKGIFQVGLFLEKRLPKLKGQEFGGFLFLLRKLSQVILDAKLSVFSSDSIEGDYLFQGFFFGKDNLDRFAQTPISHLQFEPKQGRLLTAPSLFLSIAFVILILPNLVEVAMIVVVL